MEREELQVIAFQIIAHSGDARDLIHKAFSLMREYKFDEALKQLDAANEAVILAHRSQTNMLSKYAGGEEIVMEIIMVHAQDHLMTTINLYEVALEVLEIYKQLAKK